MSNKQFVRSVPFTFDGMDGVIDINSEYVTYGGVGFQRSAATAALQEAIDQAIDDYFDNIERNE